MGGRFYEMLSSGGRYRFDAISEANILYARENDPDKALAKWRVSYPDLAERIFNAGYADEWRVDNLGNLMVATDDMELKFAIFAWLSEDEAFYDIFD